MKLKSLIVIYILVTSNAHATVWELDRYNSKKIVPTQLDEEFGYTFKYREFACEVSEIMKYFNDKGEFAGIMRSLECKINKKSSSIFVKCSETDGKIVSDTLKMSDGDDSIKFKLTCNPNTSPKECK